MITLTLKIVPVAVEVAETNDELIQEVSRIKDLNPYFHLGLIDGNLSLSVGSFETISNEA